MGGISRSVHVNYSNVNKIKHKNNQSKKTILGFLKIKLNNVNCVALLDSGASVNSISYDLFIKLLSKIKIVQINSEINDAVISIGGNKIQPFAKIRIQLKIEDLTWKQEFLVLKNLPVPCIISYHFMRESGIILMPFLNGFYFHFRNQKFYSFLSLNENFALHNNLQAMSLNNNNINNDPHDLLNYFINKYPAVLTKKLGKTNVMKIHLEKINNKVIHCPPYPLNPPQLEAMKEIINDLISKKVITKSYSPYGSPAFLVPKPDKKSFRLVVNYQKINKLIKYVDYPLPTINSVCDFLRDATYFSVIDLNQSFHQVPLSKESAELTSFIVPFGKFQYNCLPFGMRAGSGYLSMLIDTIFAEEKCKIVWSFVDDLLVYTSGPLENHIRALDKIFSKLKLANLTINPCKMQLAQKSIKFLGHIISHNSIKIDPDRTTAILNIPTPRTLKQLASFVGAISYYAKYLPNLSEILTPLTDLKKNNSKLIWSDKEQNSFNKAKSVLAKAPILQMPDFKNEFVLSCDASHTAVGSFLGQYHDGTLLPIAFHSAKLSTTQIGYNVCEKELLAIISGIEHFSQYLKFKKFLLRSDCAPLTWLINNPKLTGKLNRWLCLLQAYDFEIQHVPGKNNKIADLLSRQVAKDTPCLERPNLEFEQRVVNSWPGLVLLQFPELFESIETYQNKDKKLIPIINKLKQKINIPNYFLKKNILHFQNNKMSTSKVVVPSVLYSVIYKYFHDSEIGSHLGFRKTLQRIRQIFTYQGMTKDIKQRIKNCLTCAKIKSSNMNMKHSMESNIESKVPFEKVYIDLIGPLPRGNLTKAQYILIGIDSFSKFIFAKPLSKATAITIVNTLKIHVLPAFGVPKLIVSDRAAVFRSRIYKNFCFSLGITYYLNIPYFPQANAVERTIRTLKTCITAYCATDQKNWDKNLHLYLIALNNSEHSSTGFSPSLLFLGREMFHPLNLKFTVDEDIYNTLNKSKLQKLWDIAFKNLITAHQLAKQQYNKNAKNIEFKEGDIVMYKRYELSDKLQNKNAKLLPRFSGPFVIKSKRSKVSYCLQLKENPQKTITAHITQLKPYKQSICE